MVGEIADRLKEQMNICLEADDAVLDHLVDKGYDPTYGARPLRRAIQNEVEDAMAEEVLDGNINSGDTVRLVMEDEKIIFRLV